MKKPASKNNRGFTLIEMLVSIALFAIVLVVILSSILTVVDVSKKSQSLTIVMNDMNFVLENVTRSVKTGELVINQSLSGDKIVVNEDLDGRVREVTYEIGNDVTLGIGRIYKTISDNGTIVSKVAITSDNIDIHTDQSQFIVKQVTTSNRQPRVLMNIAGTVKISEKISSSFNIQTTVSQRTYDLTTSGT